MENSHGILINSHALSETSLIVVWCTAASGVVRTAARGARRPKSAFAGKLDLFHSAELTWKRGRSELHPLLELRVDNYRQGLRRNYLTTLCASYFCRLVEQCLEPEHPVPEIYELLERGLNYLEREEPDLRALRHFEREFAKIEGCYQAGREPAFLLENHFGSLPRMRPQLLGRLQA